MDYRQKIVKTGLDYQLDKRSSSEINSPKYLIAANQAAARSDTPNKENKVRSIDSVDVTKYFVRIDGIRNPKGSLDVEYARSNYHSQYRIPKLPHEKYFGELLLNPFVT